MNPYYGCRNPIEDPTVDELLRAIDLLGGDMARTREMEFGELEMYLDDLRY